MGRLLAIGLLVAAAVIAVVVVGGPGADPSEDAARSTSPRGAERARAGRPADTVAATDPAQPGTRVRMDGLRFARESVRVRRGRPVLFVNADEVAHTVYEDLGATSGKTTTLDSGRIEPGETFAYRPPARGTILIVCTLHPSVMATRLEVSGGAS